MKNIQEIISEIRKNILSKKEVSKKDIDNAILLLETIKNDEQHQQIYNDLMGKILLKQSNYLEAKNYFKEELKIDPNSSSAFYNLYKIAIYEKNYDNAINNLILCKENSSHSIEITFHLTLLQITNDIKNNFESFLNTNYQITVPNQFLYTKLTTKEVITLYQEIINNLNNKNYLKLRTNLIIFNNLITKLNIKTEVFTTINLIDDLIKSLNEQFEKKLNEYDQNNNYDNNCKNLLILGLNQQLINIKFVINYIDKIHNHNIELANYLLEYITNNYNLNNYEIEVNYLKNKINEKNLYHNLSKDEKAYYDLCIGNGHIAYKNNDLETAMYYYEAGLYITNHPIFNYYIGKMYFKNKNFDIAHKYFLTYEQNGGEKELKALLYIWTYLTYINSNKNNNKKIVKIDEKANQLTFFFDSLKSWNLIDYKQHLKKTPKDENFDRVKYRVSSKIFMTPEDFQEANLKLSEFYTYSLKEKLILLKNLYSTGEKNTADTLLKELETHYQDSYSKKQISSFRKNKTLYLNKAKRR